MFVIVLLLFTFSAPIHSQEQSYFQACFKNKSLVQSALKKISFIKNKEDRIAQESRCLNFYIHNQRHPLYKKFLNIQFNGQFKITSNYSSPNQECRLELKKISKAKNRSQILNLAKRSHISIAQDKHQSLSTSQILVTSGSEAIISANSQSLKIYCEVRHSQYYVKISSTSAEISLSISRTLAKGQEIELAQFIQKLNDKNNKFSLQQGIKTKQDNGRKIVSIKLKAN